jgi:hypothetical protein
MSLGEAKLREIVCALGVVALIFLNFAHAPLATGGESAAVGQTVNSVSFCGDAIDSPANAKGEPCQACRIGGGADLPPAPKVARPAATTAPMHYLPATSCQLAPADRSHARPRAPPLA